MPCAAKLIAGLFYIGEVNSQLLLNKNLRTGLEKIGAINLVEAIEKRAVGIQESSPKVYADAIIQSYNKGRRNIISLT
jgi:hypothetical protein